MAINREVISGILEKTGVSIDYAVDGLDAVETFRRQGDKYDLIMMDIQMPNMDGAQPRAQYEVLA